MPTSLPAMSGEQLIRLLEADGWERRHKSSTHGVVLTKRSDDGHTRRTVVPPKSRPLASGTLSAILSERQSGIGRDGLLALIEQHGLH